MTERLEVKLKELKKEVRSQQKKVDKLKTEAKEIKNLIPNLKKMVFTRSWAFICPGCQRTFLVKYDGKKIKFEPKDLIIVGEE